MKHFIFKNKKLFCEGLSVAQIAEGRSTPFYLYSKKAFLEQYESLAKSFAALNPLICYSVKTNGSLAVMKMLKDAGSGFDIVSGGELHRCRKIGADMSKVVYAGVGKRDDEITAALKAGILMFNCESINEIRRINFMANRIGRKARIAVRINPDVDAKTHHYITTGKKETKFGISFAVLESYLNEIKTMKNIIFSGIHMHIGSQITTAAPYGIAIRRLLGFADKLKKDGFSIESLNIGGGFGIQYGEGKDMNLGSFAKMIVPLLKNSGYRIIMEPGRYIAGNSGALISRVLYIKDGLDKKFVIVDAGMHNLIRPSLYDAYHTIVPIDASGKKKIKVDVVGPVCESGDFFAKGRALPEVKERDLLAVLNAGAYGMAMSSRYNSHPFVEEVLVDGDKARTIRKPETYDDMTRNEVF